MRALIASFSLAWLCLPASSATDELSLDGSIRELIYQAEVHQRSDWSLKQLRQLLQTAADQAARRRIVRAIATVNDPLARLMPEGARLELALHRPQALVRYRHAAYFLVEGLWLGLGDWLGDQFVLEIDERGTLLEARNGLQRRLDFEIAPVEDLTAGYCLLFGAEIDDVLFFISRREGLNAFIPQGISGAIEGRYQVDDWLTLLDCICAEYGISWTRRRDSVVFTRENDNRKVLSQRTKDLFLKGESLMVFLQDFATSFDMGLIVDDRLSEMTVNLHSENQTWDEVLDCLAIAHGFAWDLIQETGERPQLVVHKE